MTKTTSTPPGTAASEEANGVATAGPLAYLAAWSGALAHQTQERPGRTVALALGTGFILGGGLFSSVTARVVRLGLRLLVVPMLVEGLGALAAGALASGGARTVVDESAKPHRETTRRRHAHEAR